MEKKDFKISILATVETNSNIAHVAPNVLITAEHSLNKFLINLLAQS